MLDSSLAIAEPDDVDVQEMGMRMTKLCLGLSGITFALASVGCGSRHNRIAEALEYEPETPSGCAAYSGKVNGNDSLMDVKLVLCPTPNGLGGWIRYMSQESGWSIRQVEGQATNDTVVLRDIRFLENHPTSNWRLCLVDRYSLRQSEEGKAVGEYVSSACNDSATMVVRRTGP